MADLFPSTFDPARSCRICTYVGETAQQLDRHNRYRHSDVVFSNVCTFAGNYRAPNADTPRCVTCGIFIGFNFIIEHDLNELHKFKSQKTNSFLEQGKMHGAVSAKCYRTSFAVESIHFRSAMSLRNVILEFAPLHRNEVIYGVPVINSNDRSEWLKLPVSEAFGGLYLPFYYMGERTLTEVSHEDVSRDTSC